MQYLADLVARVRERGPLDVVIDNGGPGRVVGDMLVARGIYPIRIAIVGTGEAQQTAPDRLLVSQGELIHTTVKLSQQGILKLAPRLQGMATIRDELQKFMVKVSLRGHETFGNFLPGSHDDLIYALSLSCWYANSPWGDWRSVDYLLDGQHPCLTAPRCNDRHGPLVLIPPTAPSL